MWVNVMNTLKCVIVACSGSQHRTMNHYRVTLLILLSLLDVKLFLINNNQLFTNYYFFLNIEICKII